MEKKRISSIVFHTFFLLAIALWLASVPVMNVIHLYRDHSYHTVAKIHRTSEQGENDGKIQA